MDSNVYGALRRPRMNNLTGVRFTSDPQVREAAFPRHRPSREAFGFRVAVHDPIFEREVNLSYPRSSDPVLPLGYEYVPAAKALG